MKKVKQFSREKFEGKSFNPNSHIDAMYEGEWREYSKEFLKENPTCYACGQRSEAVDHVVAHKGDEKLFWKLDNFLPLCHRCHNTITAFFDRHFKQRLKEKLEWLSKSRRNNELTGSVKTVPRKR